MTQVEMIIVAKKLGPQFSFLLLEVEAISIFYVIFFQCKWDSGVDNYEAEIAADSVIWELIARKSAECLNLRNSFITISTMQGLKVK